jgi:hypothetical protein
MKTMTFIAIGACILVAGCSFRSERVEQPAPATTTQRTTTVYSDPYRPPASTTTTTVTTPSR